MTIIEQMLAKYAIDTENDLINALKEIFQEIALLGLYRGDFFANAAFYGGTALRILYGSNRFSEDLDFSLIEKNPAFNIEMYFQNIIEEFEALGLSVVISRRSENKDASGIESAFLKNNTSIHTLNIQAENNVNLLKGLHPGKKIKIKLEVDTNPPLNFRTEVKTLLMPVTFNIVSMTLPNLYAGKMHAVLCRKWKTRVKGRDWFDFEWYVSRNTKLNLVHLRERMIESGDLEGNENLDKDKFVALMNAKIDSLNIEKVIQEVKPFIKDHRVFDLWTREHFRMLTNRVMFSEEY
jgi:hypothetical protein